MEAYRLIGWQPKGCPDNLYTYRSDYVGTRSGKRYRLKLPGTKKEQLEEKTRSLVDHPSYPNPTKTIAFSKAKVK